VARYVAQSDRGLYLTGWGFLQVCHVSLSPGFEHTKRNENAVKKPVDKTETCRPCRVNKYTGDGTGTKKFMTGSTCEPETTR
jgi:hypothetical protein